VEEPKTSARERALAWADANAKRLLPWVAALVFFIIAVQTAPEVLDLEAVEGGLLPMVAAAAAFPFGLLLTRPLLGWLISAASALVVSQVFPILDDDPWPWPPIHGIVLLSLLFALTALRPPRNVLLDREIVLKLGAWAATAALFGTLSDEPAGWVVGVTAVAIGGAVTRFVTAESPAPVQARGVRLPPDWTGDLRRSLREAFLGWPPSPPAGRPFASRFLGDRAWLQWVRTRGPWILAVCVFAIALADFRDNLVIHDLVLPVVAALVALPVGLMRDRILIGWRIITLVAVVLAVVATPAATSAASIWPPTLQWVWIGSLFLVSVRHERWTTIWVWTTSILVMSTGLPENSGTATTLIAIATGIAFLGDLLRTRRQVSLSLEQQTEMSELERARRTVLEERARIARDLHDVVAHHMSMVVVQAESAPYRLEDLSEQARAEFAAISRSAREALNEVRGLLGVLRSRADTPQVAPQPTVEQVADLVGAAQRSGASVSVEYRGDARPVSAMTSVSAYRIVQEALANTWRHAPGARVSVVVTYAPGNLHLRVYNDAPAQPAVPGPAGHGISGMRERAAAVGGTLRAGPTADGGFEVVAELPIEPGDGVS
jgi:signal transduction histidine kinase